MSEAPAARPPTKTGPKPEAAKRVNSAESKRTYKKPEDDPAFKTANEKEKTKALKIAQNKTWDSLLQDYPDKVQNYADQGNEDAKAALKRQRRRERYAEKKREAEASNATPLKPELVPDLDEPITFLTPDQIARRDELKAKTTPTTSEKNELNSLNAADPFKQYEKLQERLGEGEVLSADEQAFAEKFEATEEYKKLKEEEVKKAKEDEAKAIEDATREFAGPDEAEILLRVLSAEGKTSKAIETFARELLSESDSPQSQAMGMDLLHDSLVFKIREDEEQASTTKNPGKKSKIEERIKTTKQELSELTQKRKDFSDKEENKKWSENQWVPFAEKIIGSPSKGKSPIVETFDHISELADGSKQVLDNEISRWLKEGILPNEETKDSMRKLLSSETPENQNNNVGNKVKKIGIIAALLLALSVWAAAKKAGADNQMGGR